MDTGWPVSSHCPHTSPSELSQEQVTWNFANHQTVNAVIENKPVDLAILLYC